MAALFAPQPLRLSDAPTIVDTEGHAPLSPHVGRSSFAGLDEDPFAVLHAQISKPAPSPVHQYLLPAPRISERRSKSKPHCKSPTPCNAIINKSSSLLAAPRSPRRRRHHASHARAACGFPPRNPAAFDALSWISALDSTEAVDPWNIADLSQLPIDDDRASRLSGPIRRRKTSSSSRADAVRSLGLDAGARLKPESAPEPEPLVAPSRDVMCTPPPRLPSASHIQFHNLMPVWSPRATF